MREERLKKMKERTEAYNNAVKNIMTKEQFEEYSKGKEELPASLPVSHQVLLFFCSHLHADTSLSVYINHDGEVFICLGQTDTGCKAQALIIHSVEHQSLQDAIRLKIVIEQRTEVLLHKLFLEEHSSICTGHREQDAIVNKRLTLFIGHHLTTVAGSAMDVTHIVGTLPLHLCILTVVLHHHRSFGLWFLHLLRDDDVAVFLFLAL